MLDNVIVRLVIFYIAAILFFVGLMRVFPQIPHYIAIERARQGQRFGVAFEETEEAKPDAQRVPVGADMLTDPQTTIPVTLGLCAAFLVSLPVTWVYRWTRPRKRYNQAFAHTLLVVPIAIALVVFLVKGSLALAFSLAGIVAAVRFRTSLNEPMDAVYMFMVIGIGLAAGVQLLAVAAIASLIFNAVALGVWRLDYAAKPALLKGWKIVRPDESGQLLGVSGIAQPPLDAGPSQTEKPYNAQLRMHTTQVEAAQRSAVPILRQHAKRWQVAQVIQKEDGTSIVEYDVRLKKSVDLPAFIREIEKSEEKYVAKVELTKRKAGKLAAEV